MKKILFLALMIGTFVANAQSTTPRFGTTPSTDNTFRKLTNGYLAIADAAGTDSTTLYPTKYNNYYRITLTDSLYLSNPTITKSYAGDLITLIVTGSSGNKLNFGTNWVSAGRATLSTGVSAIITFVFSGAKWIEKSRVVQ